MTDFRTYEVVQHWAIAFSKDSAYPWWKRICPGKYKHVSLFRFSAPADSWLYIDVNFSGVDVILAPGDTEAIEVICKAMGDVDVLTIGVQAKPKIMFSGLMTCVSFVKHALGITNPFVQFPDQLYNYLVKAGAESVQGSVRLT